LQLFTRDTVPLVGLQSADLKFAFSDSLRFASVHGAALELNIRPDDVEVFVPEFTRYAPVSHEPHQPRTVRAKCDIALLTIRVINNEAMVLAVVTGRGVAADHSALPDGSANLNINIATMSIVDEQSNDEFRNLLECQSSHDDFCVVSLDRAPEMMKRPVYRKIEFHIAPCVIRIPLKFIKSLIKLFPTAGDLKMLVIDPDEQIDEEPEVIGEAPETDTNCIFCQEFLFSPFQAVLNLRRKEKGVFSEINDLTFQYKGIHIYDFHGTREQLTTYVKTHLKRGLLKALPVMLLRKKRRVRAGETQTEE
jgi:hypothetical protein